MFSRRRGWGTEWERYHWVFYPELLKGIGLPVS